MGEADQPDRHSGTRVFLAFVLCVVMYFLSAGPAVWLAQHGYVSRANPFLTAFYAPVRWIVMQSELLMSSFVWYLELWGA